MPDSERVRILNLLEAGRITAEQAAVLLEALGEEAGPPRPPAPPTPPKPRPPAQQLRISIDAQEAGRDRAKVNVNVPLKLARFAARFLPADARRELDAQGIDLNELLAGLGDEVPDGPLVDLDASDESGEHVARIRIEVH